MTKESSVPLWMAQAFEQRAQHEPSCSWSREACVCSCGLFELRLRLANAMEPTSPTNVTRLPVRDSRIAPISDRVDDLVRELQRQGMRTLRASFNGMRVRIDPESENDNG